jgi:hypothetical protein
MKLVFMQNNDEQIFDGFIRGRLENTAPDMTLFDSAFNTFLLERKDKKKKRWFFWLFLFLLVFMIPVGYFIINNKSNLRDTNMDVSKEKASIITNDTNTISKTEIKGQRNSSDTAFIGKKELSKSANLDLAEEKKTKDIDKVRQKKIADKSNTTEQNEIANKIIPADSTILSGNISQKNISKAVDSVMKKKDKIVAKKDTFYIVW